MQSTAQHHPISRIARVEDHPHKKVVCYHHIISLPQIMISGTKKCTHAQNSGHQTLFTTVAAPNYCVNANKITCLVKKPCCVSVQL